MPPRRVVIPHSRPTVDEEDIGAVVAVLRSGHLAQGQAVAQFERDVAAYLGRRGGVATSSGTAALHLALLALGIGPGDEVVLPSYTCVALLHAVTYVGAAPVLAEVDPQAMTVCPDDVARRLTRRTRALIVPHMHGLAADLDPLLALGVPVVEDCAQAFGATYRGRPAGSFGVVAVCSFYATKVLTTGEGGMLVADDDRILARARDLRDYDGRDALCTRYNYKMTDFQAALGCSQLRRLPRFLARRRAIAATYSARLAHLPVGLPVVPQGRGHIFYRYVIRVEDSVRASRHLADRGVDAKPPVPRPLHHLTGQTGFPVTDAVARTALSLPIYPTLTDAEVEHVAAAVAEAVRVDRGVRWQRSLLVSSWR